MTGSADSPLGLARGQVRLAEPTPRWPALYAEEAARLAPALAAFGPTTLAHCGSTSVPGLPAKPILDLLVGLPAPFDVAALARALAPLAVEYATLERTLAARYPEDRAAYTDAKGAFTARVLAEPGAAAR